MCVAITSSESTGLNVEDRKREKKKAKIEKFHAVNRSPKVLI
jgi:hypothetical protein